ncbi:hypothetical protein MNBD_BACTEROID05-858, partial [hydrothermal vent metagenome]
TLDVKRKLSRWLTKDRLKNDDVSSWSLDNTVRGLSNRSRLLLWIRLWSFYKSPYSILFGANKIPTRISRKRLSPRETLSGKLNFIKKSLANDPARRIDEKFKQNLNIADFLPFVRKFSSIMVRLAYRHSVVKLVRGTKRRLEDRLRSRTRYMVYEVGSKRPLQTYPPLLWWKDGLKFSAAAFSLHQNIAVFFDVIINSDRHGLLKMVPVAIYTVHIEDGKYGWNKKLGEASSPVVEDDIILPRELKKTINKLVEKLLASGDRTKNLVLKTMDRMKDPDNDLLTITRALSFGVTNDTIIKLVYLLDAQIRERAYKKFIPREMVVSAVKERIDFQYFIHSEISYWEYVLGFAEEEELDVLLGYQPIDNGTLSGEFIVLKAQIIDFSFSREGDYMLLIFNAQEQEELKKREVRISLSGSIGTQGIDGVDLDVEVDLFDTDSVDPIIDEHVEVELSYQPINGGERVVLIGQLNRNFRIKGKFHTYDVGHGFVNLEDLKKIQSYGKINKKESLVISAEKSSLDALDKSVRGFDLKIKIYFTENVSSPITNQISLLRRYYVVLRSFIRKKLLHNLRYQKPLQAYPLLPWRKDGLKFSAAAFFMLPIEVLAAVNEDFVLPLGAPLNYFLAILILTPVLASAYYSIFKGGRNEVVIRALRGIIVVVHLLAIYFLNLSELIEVVATILKILLIISFIVIVEMVFDSLYRQDLSSKIIDKEIDAFIRK